MDDSGALKGREEKELPENLSNGVTVPMWTG
jgi:hypothetical protein